MSAADARARGYRSAWADAEHVRLAMFRSPWDQGSPALRGPLPARLDPWRVRLALPPGRVLLALPAGTGAAA
jgi:hypothetical protein